MSDASVVDELRAIRVLLEQILAQMTRKWDDK
jgi:hypothetical protein